MIETRSETADQILRLAEMFLFVREATGNKNTGPWVEAMQRIGRTGPQQPWCACFVMFVLGMHYADKPPLKYTASCDDILAEARAKHMIVTTPLPGDLFLVMKSANDAEHVGFVTDVDATSFGEIAGNTNPDGGRDGLGVFTHVDGHARKLTGPYTFVRYIA